MRGLTGITDRNHGNNTAIANRLHLRRAAGLEEGERQPEVLHLHSADIHMRLRRKAWARTKDFWIKRIIIRACACIKNVDFLLSVKRGIRVGVVCACSCVCVRYISTSPGYWLNATRQAPLLMEPVMMASTVGSGFSSPAPEY